MSNLARVKQIVHHIIQVEHAVWKNPKHRDYSSLEFVLNQTTAMTEMVTTAIIRFGYVQAQRHETFVLETAWQHCVVLNNHIMRQSGRGREKKDGIPSLVLQ